MRTILFFIVSFVTFSGVFAQNFDEELEKMAKSMATKLNTKSNLDVAVYPFYNKDKKQTDLSKLISDDFSVYLDQNSASFKVMERSLLEQMMAEHQLNDEGLIDPRTAKEFGMLIAADAYITGKILIISTYVRLQVFAIDTQTGERIYSDYKKIPLDHDIAEFVGVNLKERMDKVDMYKSSNPDCTGQQVGDYCFVNKLNVPLYVLVSNTGVMATFYRNLTIAPNSKACVKNLSANKSYYYQCSKSSVVISDVLYQSEFQVKTCKSDYAIIR